MRGLVRLVSRMASAGVPNASSTSTRVEIELAEAVAVSAVCLTAYLTRFPDCNIRDAGWRSARISRGSCSHAILTVVD